MYINLTLPEPPGPQQLNLPLEASLKVNLSSDPDAENQEDNFDDHCPSDQ